MLVSLWLVNPSCMTVGSLPVYVAHELNQTLTNIAHRALVGSKKKKKLRQFSTRCCNLSRKSKKERSAIIFDSNSNDNGFSRTSTCHNKAEGKKTMSAHILVAKDDNLSGCLTTPGIPPHPQLRRLWAGEIVFMLHLCSTALWKLGMQHWPSILSKSVPRRP